MRAEDYISANLPQLAPEDSAAEALEVMTDTLQPELPVVDGLRYMGVARESQLLGLPDDSIRIGDIPHTGLAAQLPKGHHFFEVLKLAAEHKTGQVAITDDEGSYYGSVLLSDLAARMGQSLSLTQDGGVLVLSIPMRDYSMAEIARLVESNDARLLNSFIESDPENSEAVIVTLRINQPDLTRIAHTFERFGYSILARFHKSHSPDVDSERLNSLLRYLDI